MSRYAAAHAVLAGPGDSRPTALQIIRDEQLEAPAMKDKVVVMTGASAGIGIETARALASTGARCFLGVRNLEKGATACQEFLEPGRVELFQIDTSSLASVRKAAEHLRAQTKTISILVNNAGIMAVPTLEKSVDGFESQFATNYLGHFLLYRLLEDRLLAGSTPAFHSRVVNVSSAGHQAGGVVFENLNLEGDGVYEPWKAYGQSKTAMIYMTNHIERLHGAQGVHGYSITPGGIASNLQKHIPEETKAGWAKDKSVLNFMKSPEQGAATTVYCAVGKEWEGQGGKYFENCDVAKPYSLVGEPLKMGVVDHAFDEEKETRLWAEASKLIGLA